MRNTFLGLSLGFLAAAGCSGPTSGAASLGFDPTLPGGPPAALQFGAVGSALSYAGDWILQLPDGGLQDAGPGLSIEMYNSGPGVACFDQFTGISQYISDGGPTNENNEGLQSGQGQWAVWINFGGFPDTGLQTGSVPLVPQSVAIGTTALGATLNIEEVTADEGVGTLTSVSGSVDITTASSSGVTGTISGLAQNLAILGAAQPGDIAAVFAAGIEGSQFDADADAGAPQATLYQDALNASLDAGATGAPLAAALEGDPDAGGTFILQGNFNSPLCATPNIDNP